jgi:signal peptidase II
VTDEPLGAAEALPTPPQVRARNGWHWLPVTVVVVILDQLTKSWIVQHFAYEQTMVVLPVLNITLRYNTGAAFSFLADASGWQRWLFTALAVGVGTGILIWLRRLNARRQPLLALSLTLILAGALGNLIDRLRLGHVIDFVDVHWKDAHFAAFNVADSAITIGAALMLLDAWLEGRRRSS